MFFVFSLSLSSHISESVQFGINRTSLCRKKKDSDRQTRLCNALREVLGSRIEAVAIYHRYDVEGINDADYEQAKVTVFSRTTPVDALTDSMPDGDMSSGRRILPGQYDQRADSAEQCLAILTGKDGIRVRALHYVLTGHFEDERQGQSPEIPSKYIMQCAAHDTSFR